MADKLLIVMVNSDTNNPSELVSPFFQATVAAAMEYEVEVVLNGRAGCLAIKGEAAKLQAQKNSSRTVYDILKDAYEAGVKFKVCASALDLGNAELIPEIEETVGDAYIISEAMDDNTVTFTY